MWHVTLTVVGDEVDPAEVRAALERLTHEQPFLLSARYAADRAELPAWRVAGLEVVDRATFQRRARDSPAPALVPAGGVRPF